MVGRGAQFRLGAYLHTAKQLVQQPDQPGVGEKRGNNADPDQSQLSSQESQSPHPLNMVIDEATRQKVCEKDPVGSERNIRRLFRKGLAPS